MEGLLKEEVLIIFQFAIAIVLIFSTLIIEKQIEFIRNKPLGFQKENIIYFPLNKEIGEKEDFFKTRRMQHSAVKDFAYSFAAPGDMGMVWGQQLNYEGKEFQGMVSCGSYFMQFHKTNEYENGRRKRFY